MLWWMPSVPRRSQPGKARESLFAGIHFILSKPVILGAISLDLFAVLLGGATAMLPVFAKDILMVGPTGLGILQAAPALGALGTTIWLARHPLQRRVGRILLLSVSVFGLRPFSSPFPPRSGYLCWRW